jgi:UDPglucose--hexose-1-phosphate uridylyltransferase
MGNPPYNMVFTAPPANESHLKYFHFQVRIIPRVSSFAGFELGSGTYINTVAPEQAAAFLREAR